MMVRRRILSTVLILTMLLGYGIQGNLYGAELTTVEGGQRENESYSSDESDFYIEDGVVTGYKGPGGVVTIPDGVTTIGDYAFSGSKNITDIIIPEGVTWIGFNAFEQCNKLASVSIPSSMVKIKDYAFSYCGELASITIPQNVIEIGKNAFSGCNKLNISIDENNSYYSCKDGVIYNKDQTQIICAVGGATDITIPEGVTAIDQGAFASCYNLEKVTIPDSVTSIGKEAFYNCVNLKSVNIPKGVTVIENDVFWFCRSLTSITIPKGVTSIGSDAFFNCSSLESVTIPEGVTRIGAQAFTYCLNLSSVNIPNGVRYISDEAFSSCLKLTNVEIPSSVYSVGSEAFYDCPELSSVTISEGVERIAARAFGHCDNLSYVLIPRTVTYIGDFAFGYMLDYDKCSNFKIGCYRGTAGEKYAISNGIEYEILDCETHSFGEWETTTPATCQKEGQEERTCSVCGAIEKRAIAKSKHMFKKYKTIVATSRRKGYTIYKCSWCGCEEKRNYTTFIGKAKIMGIRDKYYTGKQIKQSIKIKYGNTTLKKGVDYSVSYKNNVRVGRATVTITGKGKYSGSISKTFKILSKKR